MNLTVLHEQAAELMVENELRPLDEQLTLTEIGDAVGRTKRALVRWRADPDFLDLLQQTRARWRDKIDDLPFVHRRGQLVELNRLYSITPDSAGLNKNTGLEILNVPAKAALLKQMADLAGLEPLDPEKAKEREHSSKDQLLATLVGIVNRHVDNPAAAIADPEPGPEPGGGAE